MSRTAGSDPAGARLGAYIGAASPHITTYLLVNPASDGARIGTAAGLELEIYELGVRH